MKENEELRIVFFYDNGTTSFKAPSQLPDIELLDLIEGLLICDHALELRLVVLRFFVIRLPLQHFPYKKLLHFQY